MNTKQLLAKPPAAFLLGGRFAAGGGGAGELWSADEKLCFSLLIQAPPRSSPPSQLLRRLLQIHAFLLRRSLDSNLSLLTLLVSSSPSPCYAVRAFRCRPAQDDFLCNSVLRCLVRHRRFRESVELYRDLLRRSSPSGGPPFSPDGFTFPPLLSSCAKIDPSSCRAEGPQLHGHVLKMGFCRDVFSATALLDMYSKTGSARCARKVFDEMHKRSTASWTAMLVCYARAGNAGAAVGLFSRMPVKDVAAFNAMIDVFIKVGDLSSARRLFDQMTEKDVVSWTSLLSGYCKAGDVDAARFLFDEMPEKNLYSWNAMIGGYCQNRMPHEALALFRELLQSGACPFDPDEVTILAVMPAISDTGAIELGLWAHNYVRRKGIESKPEVSTSLLDMYAKCGDVARAKKVFDGILDKSVVSWNAMINGLAINGCAEDALGVFEEMLRSGARPNELTMLGVLSACSHGGLVKEGRKWFREMETSYGLTPKVEHYGCMVDLLGRGGHLKEAERLIGEMPYDATGILLSSLLFSCGCCGDVARAERVMSIAVKVEPWNVNNYITMRNLYAGERRWSDVKRVKEVLCGLGGKRVAGSSVIEIGRRVWEFVSGDVVHPEREAIFMSIGGLKWHMKGEEGEQGLDNNIPTW